MPCWRDCSRIVNALHGLWSVGAVVGGHMGAAAAGLATSLEAHLAVSAVLFSAAALACARVLLPGREDAERGADDGTPAVTAPPGPTTVTSRRRSGLLHRPAVLLAPLGALALCGAFVEDAGASWGALYLRGVLLLGRVLVGSPARETADSAAR